MASISKENISTELKPEVKEIFRRYFGSEFDSKSICLHQPSSWSEYPPKVEVYLVLDHRLPIEVYEVYLSYTDHGFGLWSNLQYSDPKRMIG
jgi:hypothetical protein